MDGAEAQRRNPSTATAATPASQSADMQSHSRPAAASSAARVVEPMLISSDDEDEQQQQRAKRRAATGTAAQTTTTIQAGEKAEEEEDEDYQLALQASLQDEADAAAAAAAKRRRNVGQQQQGGAAASAAAAAGNSPSSVACAASSNGVVGGGDSGVSAQLLPFQAQIVRNLLREDGLVILGRGLGLPYVWLGFLAHYLYELPSPQSVTGPLLASSSPLKAASSSASAAAAAVPSAPLPSSASPHLIFLLNFDDDLIGWLNEQFQTHAHPASTTSAPTSATAATAHRGGGSRGRGRGIRSINNEYNASERASLYLHGGLLSITARILTVDLLNNLISPDLITGFCVHDAHTAGESSPEAFILRIWRKKNKRGWIKAATDDALACSRGGGGRSGGGTGSFAGMEIVMKALFLRKVWLFPRFTMSVNDSLQAPDPAEQDAAVTAAAATARRGPSSSSAAAPPCRRFNLDIVELHQPFSELMTGIQSALIEVIDTLITQLKRENQHLSIYEHRSTPGGNANPNDGNDSGRSGSTSGSNSDASTSKTLQSLNLSIEAGLLKNFESLLRAELGPIQHKLSSKTRALLADLSSLRQCIGYLLNYDCITFYRYLLLIKSAAVNSSSGGSHSTWLLSDAAERLFKLAKARLYTYQPALSRAQIDALALKRDKLVRQHESLLLKATTTAAASSTTTKHNATKKAAPGPKRAAAASGSQSGASKDEAMELSSDDEVDATTKAEPDAASAQAVARSAAAVESATAALSSASNDSLNLVLEENPKWSLLLDTLEEIETDVQARAIKLQEEHRNQQLTDIMRPVKPEPGTDSKTAGAAATSGANGAEAPPFRLPPSFGRTLLLVRDARTATFLTRLLSIGGRNLLRIYWKKYLFSLKLHKRNLTPMDNNAAGPSSSSMSSSSWLAKDAAARAKEAGAASSVAGASRGAAASSLPSSSGPSQSVLYAQFQRESVLLKRELDVLMEEEALERYKHRQLYVQDLAKAREMHGAAAREAQQRQIDAEFDLGDETSTAAASSVKMAASAAKAKTAAAKANPYKAATREGSIEALEREIDAEQAHASASPPATSAVGKPATASKPAAIASAPGAARKRGAKAIAGVDAATDARKKAKKRVGGESGADADGEDDDGAVGGGVVGDDAAPPSADADVDADVLIEDEDEEEGRAAAAAASTTSSEAATATAAARASSSSSPSEQQATGGASSFMFDRSDVSVIDAAFQMGLVQQPAATANKSPHFANTAAATSASAASRSISMPLLSSSSSVTVLPAYQLLVHPLAHLHSLLARYSPEYVLLFDPDIAAVRALETFQAHPATPGPIKCFFLMYSNSLEEQRYIASIEQENKAFDQLIHTKKNMVVPLEQDGRLPERDERSRIDGSGNMSAEERRNSNLYEDGTRNNTYEAYAATLPNKSDTRRGGAGMDAPGTVLVDVREFRSSLPSQLHAANLVLQPLTLEIADYILTPTLAVERKSVPDLVGSLASGRLYKQMEQAIRYYKTPVLLIEFDRGRPFLLQSKADLTGDISSRSVLSRLVLLMLHFPQMRLLWSRDSHATTRLFLALKARQSQPTLEQAVVANSHSLRSVQNQAGTINEFVDASVGAGMTDEEREDAQLSLTPHDILRKLPGVNAVNIRGLLQHVSNLRELSECTLAQLTSWMGGAIAAKKLHTFLHDDLTSKIA